MIRTTRDPDTRGDETMETEKEDSYLIRQCCQCKKVDLYVKPCQTHESKHHTEWASETRLPSVGYAFYLAAKKEPKNVIDGITHGICEPCLEQAIEQVHQEEKDKTYPW